MAFCTLRCQVRNQNANTASGIMGASIGKACSCPSFPHTHFAHIYGMCGFHGLNQSLRHSGILPSKLKVQRVLASSLVFLDDLQVLFGGIMRRKIN
jgi:hypothetical protein